MCISKTKLDTSIHQIFVCTLPNHVNSYILSFVCVIDFFLSSLNLHKQIIFTTLLSPNHFQNSKFSFRILFNPKKEKSFGTLATKKELLLVFLGILEIHMTTRQCKSGSEQNGLGLGLEKVQNFRRLRKDRKSVV